VSVNRRAPALAGEGSWTARVEDRPLLFGEGQFVADIDHPDQLWMRVVRSPEAHGRILDIETDAASRSPGVRAVLTAKDLTESPRIPVRVVPVPGIENRLQPVLAHERVRYAGEPVAIVVAEDPYLAEDAAELVYVDIEPLSPVIGAWKDPSASLWDSSEDNVMCEFRGAEGSVDTTLAAAAVRVDMTFCVQRHTAAPMETRGLLAEWEKDGSRLHLWGPTKYIHFTRRTVAQFFDLDPEAVICHRVDVGGSFGVRGEIYPEDFLVPWAAQVTGQPVKWVEDRREHLISINHSREHINAFSLGVSQDGKFLAFRSDSVVDQGAYARPIGGRLAQIIVEALSGPYKWEAYEARCRGIVTNKTPAGTMRGPSAYEATFVRERAIDIAAAQLEMSPLEIRRRNLIHPSEMPFVVRLGSGMEEVVYDGGDYPRVVEEFLGGIEFETLLAASGRLKEKGHLSGVGLALFQDTSGLGIEESVDLTLTTDGHIVLGTSAVEIGQGLVSMVLRILMEELPIPPDRIEVLIGDSRAHSKGAGTFASRTTVFVGSAAADASRRLLAAARERAAERLGVGNASDVQVSSSGFAGDGKHLSWKEVAPISVTGSHRMEHPTYGFGACVAVVLVDPGTGDVQIERLAVGYDCGRAVDVNSARDQLIGAAVMGVGGALLEHLVFNESGQPLSTSFMDYLLPTAEDSPPVDAFVLEIAPAPGNPLGARGVGEAGIVGVGAAVANAVADALTLAHDESITSLPITPDLIMEILSVGSRVGYAGNGEAGTSTKGIG
jgi:carbon-monoxide dehydrogenase large subunit